MVFLPIFLKFDPSRLEFYTGCLLHIHHWWRCLLTKLFYLECRSTPVLVSRRYDKHPHAADDLIESTFEAHWDAALLTRCLWLGRWQMTMFLSSNILVSIHSTSHKLSILPMYTLVYSLKTTFSPAIVRIEAFTLDLTHEKVGIHDWAHTLTSIPDAVSICSLALHKDRPTTHRNRRCKG